MRWSDSTRPCQREELTFVVPNGPSKTVVNGNYNREWRKGRRRGVRPLSERTYRFKSCFSAAASLGRVFIKGPGGLGPGAGEASPLAGAFAAGAILFKELARLF